MRPIYMNVERTLQRRRRERQPPIPQSVDEFVQSIIATPFYRKNKKGTEDFYAGRVDCGEQSAVVFISRATLPALVEANELHIDATFQTVPVMFYQLLTIHAIAYDEV